MNRITAIGLRKPVVILALLMALLIAAGVTYNMMSSGGDDLQVSGQALAETEDAEDESLQDVLGQLVDLGFMDVPLAEFVQEPVRVNTGKVATAIIAGGAILGAGLYVLFKARK